MLLYYVRNELSSSVRKIVHRSGRELQVFVAAGTIAVGTIVVCDHLCASPTKVCTCSRIRIPGRYHMAQCTNPNGMRLAIEMFLIKLQEPIDLSVFDVHMWTQFITTFFVA